MVYGIWRNRLKLKIPARPEKKTPVYLHFKIINMKSILLNLLLTPLFFFANAQRPAPDNFETKIGTLSIQPIQHASLILAVKGIVIYADPSNPDNYKGLTPPDIILITDIHGDHFDIKTIEAV